MSSLKSCILDFIVWGIIGQTQGDASSSHGHTERMESGEEFTSERTHAEESQA